MKTNTTKPTIQQLLNKKILEKKKKKDTRMSHDEKSAEISISFTTKNITKYRMDQLY